MNEPTHRTNGGVARALAILLALPLGCSDAGGGEALSSTTEAIEHGALDEADTTTVALAQGTQIYCSGTLIAPRIVVTAAHCVAFREPDGVYLGGEQGGALLPVLRATRHPSFDLATLQDDIAIVELAERATVAPAPMSLRSPPSEGAAIRVVGFGAPRGSNEHVARRAGDARLDAVRATTFTTRPTPGQPCSNDSGGSAYAGGTLVGVISGGDVDCARFAVYTRVDAYADFLAPFLAPKLDARGGGCTLCPSPCASDASGATWIFMAALAAYIRWRWRLSGRRLAARPMRLSTSCS